MSKRDRNRCRRFLFTALRAHTHTRTCTMSRLRRVAHCENTTYSEAINLLLIFSTFPIQYSPLSTWIWTDGKSLYMFGTTATTATFNEREKKKLSEIVAYQKCYILDERECVGSLTLTHTHKHTHTHRQWGTRFTIGGPFTICVSIRWWWISSRVYR